MDFEDLGGMLCPDSIKGYGRSQGRSMILILFMIWEGNGGVRALRFAANYGAKIAACELPFYTISSDVAGGVGGA